ncbi:MAG: MBL fold metallo-hydrolase [Pseudomonadota bacterium]
MSEPDDESALAERGARLRFTVLGCGSSGGVPRIGSEGPNWGACDPENPRNRRRRCALLVERITADGRTTVLVDAGPDCREQLIMAGRGLLDAVVLTHDHADHCHGLDDLRMIVFNRRSRLPAYMDALTERTMRARFGYAFEAPEGSSYPPILDLLPIDGPFEVPGPGGPVPFVPFAVPHGSVTALGFRIGPLVYLPDISEMTDEAWAVTEGAEVWLLDTLRYTRHPSHANLERALDWLTRAAPSAAYLTNLHVDLDYATLDAETPPHVHPAHDGLVLDYAA